MEFKDIISVSGKSGLYKIEKPRQDGVIASELSSGKKTFLSARKHSFTPLENIGIYLITGDTKELTEVFSEIVKQGGNRPDAGGNADDIRAFFDLILPKYDEDKFRMSDMKKILQWYELLLANDVFESVKASTEEE